MEKTSATVEIDDTRKERLDRFLASLLLREDMKITLQEALGLMVEYALENEEDFIEKLKGLPPLEDDPAWEALENPEH